MKKFSKVLCLVLVLAMMAGLCCFGTSAAYADADKINYKEAVDVLSAVGVLQGDERGFRPQDGLTRAEATKIIAYLCDQADITGTCSFKDCKGHWAENYIAFCAAPAQGYVNGVGGNKFDPNGALTGYAFAKMLLGVLGYDAATEGMTGDGWEIAVAKLVKSTGLAKGIAKFDGTKAITREEAAQLGLNALKADMVYYSGGSSVTINDVEIKQGATRHVATVGAYGNLNSNGAAWNDYTPTTLNVLQLGEYLYGGKLLPYSTNDDAGRSATKWYYNAKGTAGATVLKSPKNLVGVYAKAADSTIIATKDGKTLAYWLESVSKDYAKDYDANTGMAVFNGGDSTDADVQIGAEINLTFATSGALEKVIVNTYDIAKVEKVTAVTNEDFTHTVKLNNGTAVTYPSNKLPGFDADTMVKDSYVQILYKGTTTAEVLEVKVPETVTGKITATGTNYVKVDGTKYTATFDPGTIDNDDTYEVYLVNGYVYGCKIVEDAKTTDGFVYVMDAAAQAHSGGDLGINGKDATVRVKVAYMDGTQATLDMPVVKATSDITVEGTAISGGNTIEKDHYYVTICGTKYEVCDGKVGNNNVSTLQNTFYNYSLDEDGKITLKALDTDKESAITVSETANNGIKKDVVSFTEKAGSDAKTYTVNSATTLVVVDTTGKKVGEFTGYKNFPGTEILNKNALVLHAKNSTLATTIYVIDTTTYTTATYAYYTGNKETVGSKTTYDFYVDGELKSYELGSAPAGGKVFTIDESAKTATPATYAYTTIVNEADDNFFTDAAKAAKQYSDKVKVWDVSVKDVVSEGTVTEGDSVLYVCATEGGKVETVFVLENLIKDQPDTKVELESLLDDVDDDNEYWAGYAAEIVTLGLAQTQDGSTLYISGTMDADKVFVKSTNKTAADKDASPNQKIALAKFDSRYTTVADMWTAIGEVTATKVGFINLKINGDSIVYIVGDTSTDTEVTVDGITVKVDFTGLAW